MAARAMWKGVIRVGSRELSVKLYSAVQERGVHLRTLSVVGSRGSARHHEPVEQHMVDPRTGQTVDYAEVQRGFRLDDGYILLSKDELEKLTPKAAREISVRALLPPAALGPEWFVRPYFLAPDDSGADYVALRTALQQAKREAVVHWVMRGTDYHGILRPDGDYLVLVTLRHREEVPAVKRLSAPEGRTLSAKEKTMAAQLVAMFEGDFEPEKFRDEYRDKLHALVEAKRKGKHLRLHEPVEKKTAGSLEAALGRSLKAAASSGRASGSERDEQGHRARKPARERKEKRVA
jgi:DNA end-binding protein Ku